jgi:hypothetical protein
MAAARVCDLRDAADETSAVVRELLELPDIRANDLTPREALAFFMVRQKTLAAKRLLTLMSL